MRVRYRRAMDESGAGDHVFYGSLAPWWPLISPVEDYAEEAGYLGDLLAAHVPPVREVLELGCGGGHVAYHLRDRYDLTLTDLSPDMVEVSRARNPGCVHVVGDMRTLRLGRTFDAVLVHDAIEYMTTETDLAAAMATAAAHLRPGGLVVLVPDRTTETFEPDDDHGGSDASDGRSVRFLDWSWDPDPSDSTICTVYAFVLRDADGTIRVAHEVHRTGLFPDSTWLRLLAGAGFAATSVIEETTEDRVPRTIFLGRRLA